MATQSNYYDTMAEREAFYLLKDLMETTLVCEYEPVAFQLAKLARLRNDMVYKLQNEPSIGREYVNEIWDVCFFAAKEQTEKEHALLVSHSDLSWQQVFDTDYTQ